MTVNAGRFSYYALMGNVNSPKVTSVLAALASVGSAQGVVWDIPTKAWRFDPDSTAFYLFDDRNFHMSHQVERSEAERIARELLHTELPQEDQLHQICTEGLAIFLAEEAELGSDFGEDLENEVFDDEDDEPPARPVGSQDPGHER